MAIASFFTFILGVGAAYLVPGWGFDVHFSPYAFFVAFIVAWGTSRSVMKAGVVYAFGWELLLGLHLGALPVAFLVAVLAYGFLQRLVEVGPLIHERWNIRILLLNGIIGLILWILMVVVSWGVIRLFYHIGYPFAALAQQFQDIRLVGVAILEIVLFLGVMTSINGYFLKKRI